MIRSCGLFIVTQRATDKKATRLPLWKWVPTPVHSWILHLNSYNGVTKGSWAGTMRVDEFVKGAKSFLLLWSLTRNSMSSHCMTSRWHTASFAVVIINNRGRISCISICSLAVASAIANLQTELDSQQNSLRPVNAWKGVWNHFDSEILWLLS